MNSISFLGDARPVRQQPRDQRPEFGRELVLGQLERVESGTVEAQVGDDTLRIASRAERSQIDHAGDLRLQIASEQADDVAQERDAFRALPAGR